MNKFVFRFDVLLCICKYSKICKYFKICKYSKDNTVLIPSTLVKGMFNHVVTCYTLNNRETHASTNMHI